MMTTSLPNTTEGSGDSAAFAPPDPRMIDMLVCPVTRGLLRYDRNAQELVSDQAGVAYPLRDGVPVMVEGQGRVID
jgi:uncharacterized protein YbaR (Trm112 family)